MEEKERQGLTVKKSEDFSEWYTQVNAKSNLTDIRYGIQGMLVHKPWAFKILRKIYELIENEAEKDGHEPFLFPTLIPEINLKREAEHAGFTPEVFWVTEAGSKKLEERYALRPTGESAIYPLYSLWIRSYSDLPYKGYQSRITVFRYEMTTRPFLRGREFMFLETHDVFSSHEESLKQIEKDKEMMEKVIYNELKIPFLFFQRPQWDKFKGAKDTYVADTIMPDGKRNQLSSTHDLAQNFAKAFDIKFKNKDGNEIYAFQTCWGPGIWKIMAALIAIHGDDKGLILPFNIAPIQIVIIPIIFKKEKSNEDIIKKCYEIKKKLENFGYKVKVDDSDNSPGFKYNHYELHGVPLRIEIGPNELKKNKLTIVKRTDKIKNTIQIKNLKKEIEKNAETLDEKIKENSDKYFKNNTKSANTFNDLVKIIKTHKGFVKVPFCSIDFDGEECAKKIKEKTSADVCGVIYKDKGLVKGTCIVCNKKAKYSVYVAKSY